MQRDHPLDIISEFGAVIRLVLGEGVGEIMGVTDVVDTGQMGPEAPRRFAGRPPTDMPPKPTP